jgi:hypothetical protein
MNLASGEEITLSYLGGTSMPSKVSLHEGGRGEFHKCAPKNDVRTER